MANTTNRDRNISQLEYTKTPWPLPPLNLFLTSGYMRGVYDLRWDDPNILPLNSQFQILGVNVYRSFDSEYGPYNRIHDTMVCSNYWRDQTDNILEIDEDVSESFVLSGESGTGTEQPRWVFRTLYRPIVKEASQATTANDPNDVWLKIDGIPVRPLRVNGFSGEVEIDPFIYPNVAKQNVDKSLVPGPNSKITVSYRHNREILRTDLGHRVFYRVTTVGIRSGCDLSRICKSDLVETPLEHASATNSMEIEKLDWIWREAVRRNRFILEQGGERVQAFIRKHVGIPCRCFPDEVHKQALGDCRLCYGTGILGGYEGPYMILIAPDDGERRINQTENGLNLEHTYDVWTGPAPILSQRDFIVKINGERYSIGAVRFPSNRGMVLQQHCQIGHIDELDIRYDVPVIGRPKYERIGFDPRGPEYEAKADITGKTNIPDERELRGRSKVWENIMYIFPFMFLLDNFKHWI